MELFSTRHLAVLAYSFYNSALRIAHSLKFPQTRVINVVLVDNALVVLPELNPYLSMSLS